MSWKPDDYILRGEYCDTTTIRKELVRLRTLSTAASALLLVRQADTIFHALVLLSCQDATQESLRLELLRAGRLPQIDDCRKLDPQSLLRALLASPPLLECRSLFPDNSIIVSVDSRLSTTHEEFKLSVILVLGFAPDSDISADHSDPLCPEDLNILLTMVAASAPVRVHRDLLFLTDTDAILDRADTKQLPHDADWHTTGKLLAGAALEAAIEATSSDNGVLYLATPRRRTLALTATSGNGAEFATELKVGKYPQVVESWVYHRMRPLVINDISEFAQTHPAIAPQATLPCSSSQLTVPIRPWHIHNAVHGALGVITVQRSLGYYTYRDLVTVRDIALRFCLRYSYAFFSHSTAYLGSMTREHSDLPSVLSRELENQVSSPLLVTQAETIDGLPADAATVQDRDPSHPDLPSALGQPAESQATDIPIVSQVETIDGLPADAATVQDRDPSHPDLPSALGQPAESQATDIPIVSQVETIDGLPADLAGAQDQVRGIIEHIYSLTRSVSATMRLLSPTGKKLIRFCTAGTEHRGSPPIISVSHEHSVHAWVARTGDDCYIRDIKDFLPDKAFPELLGTLNAGRGSRSELCLPIRVNGRLVGTLNLESAYVDAYGEELPLIRAMAEQIGLRLTRYRQFGVEVVWSRATSLAVNTHQLLKGVKEIRRIAMSIRDRSSSAALLVAAESIGKAIESVVEPHAVSASTLEKTIEEILETHNFAAHVEWSKRPTRQILHSRLNIAAIRLALTSLLENVYDEAFRTNDFTVHLYAGTRWRGGIEYEQLEICNSLSCPMPKSLARRLYRVPLMDERPHIGAFLAGAAIRAIGGDVFIRPPANRRLTTVLEAPIPLVETL